MMIPLDEGGEVQDPINCRQGSAGSRQMQAGKCRFPLTAVREAQDPSGCRWGGADSHQMQVGKHKIPSEAGRDEQDPIGCRQGLQDPSGSRQGSAGRSLQAQFQTSEALGVPVSGVPWGAPGGDRAGAQIPGGS